MLEKMCIYIVCICFGFYSLCVFKCVFHVLSLYKRMKSHISCIYLTFSNVCFQMSPHVACPSGCKITLAALVCSFSGVCFQIFPQTVYPGGCVIILFTSLWFFSNVSNVYSNAPHERIHSHIALWGIGRGPKQKHRHRRNVTSHHSLSHLSLLYFNSHHYQTSITR